MEFGRGELKVRGTAVMEKMKSIEDILKMLMESPVGFIISIGLIVILLSLICRCCCRGNNNRRNVEMMKAQRRRKYY
ncbi:hypothetical protein H5410_025098 [Solanum commersonii]|uniref:Uncharacterized protein n=1 Tax=Solanum commersonii TaxID=4109 RepID=A0A9J5YXJ5_SOLCO|nr:hypothetical protein H5410_025098 [Solanum commersonii]